MPEPHKLSTEKLLHILSLSELATAIYSGPDIIIESVNKAMLHIWGKEKNIVGLPLEQALPEITNQPLLQQLKTVWSTGNSYEDTDAKTDLLVNGALQSFYFDFRCRAIKDENGRMEAILYTATDVTEQVLCKQALEAGEIKMADLNKQLTASNTRLKQTIAELEYTHKKLLQLNNKLQQHDAERQKALGESESRLKAIFKQAPLAIGILSGPQQILELANDRLLGLIAKGRNVLGLPYASIRPEPEVAAYLKILSDVFTTSIPYTAHERKVFVNNTEQQNWGYFNFTYHPIKDEQGNTIAVMTLADDVTEKVNARKKVEHTEEQLRIAIDVTELGIWTVDWPTQILTQSNRTRHLYGIPPSMSLTMAESILLIDAADRALVQAAIADAIRLKNRFQVEYLMHPMDGNADKWIRATGKAEYDDAGIPLLITGTLLDITEQKANDQRKNDFIGMVSHELKTPLTSLNVYIQILQLKAAKDRYDSFTINALDKAKKQLNKMTIMINGFLNMSRLESGKIYIDKQVFNLAELIKETEEESLVVITSHKLLFEPVEYTLVNADRDKIGHVINNLISNAVKYSPLNSVIHIACITQNGLAQVSVQDAGMGIAQADIDKLFDRYYRVESDHMKSIAGFGIGLYLCKEIILRHEGRIWVESEPEKGSTFYFTLPVLAQ